MTGMPEFSPAHVEMLASGGNDAVAVAALRNSREAAVRSKLTVAASVYGRSQFVDSSELLHHASDEHIRALMSHPYTDLWAEGLARTVRQGKNELPPSQPAFLGNIAVAATIRSGGEVPPTRVSVQNGSVLLPTIGRSRVVSDETGVAKLASSSEGYTITTTQGTTDVPHDLRRDTGDWLALRTVTAEAGGVELAAEVDDLSPWGGLLQYPVKQHERLTTAQLAGFQEHFSAAWGSIMRHFPQYAPGITEYLRTLVPMTFKQGMRATECLSFGAVGLTLPKRPYDIASAILEEGQRAKFEALHKLVPLHEAPSNEPRYYAPWYEAPVSFDKLFAGAFAHGVAIHQWEVHAQLAGDVGPSEATAAAVENHRWAHRLPPLLTRLVGTGFLTKTGVKLTEGLERFAAAHAPSVRGMAGTAVRLARTLDIDHSLSWRLRNLQPESAAMDRLATLWWASLQCPEDLAVIVETKTPSSPVTGHALRYDLVRAAYSGTEPSIYTRDNAHIGDVLYAQKEYKAAEAAYIHSIRSSEHEGADAWAGLALIAAGSLNRPSSYALTNYPEVVKALHAEITVRYGRARGLSEDPLEIAAWLARLGQPKFLEY